MRDFELSAIIEGGGVVACRRMILGGRMDEGRGGCAAVRREVRSAAFCRELEAYGHGW